MDNFRIAIIGAGPAGYFTAQAFQRLQDDKRAFKIDLIERLPTPWGLVRSGVAPFHPKIKSVSKVFEKISQESDFRLFCNVDVGKDVTLKDLKNIYDAVVIATGCPKGRNLGIPGEELANCFSAGEFVPWYNSHPDFEKLSVDLDCETAVIVGAGNVALDIAKILLLDPKALASTDISETALQVLKKSKIKNVVIFSRRGPESVSFTAHELRELINIPNINFSLDIEQVCSAHLRINDNGQADKDSVNVLNIMSQLTKQNSEDNKRTLTIQFLTSPILIQGNGKVEEVTFSMNKLVNGKAVLTDETRSIKTGLVITAIGYDSIKIPGIKLENGRVTNIAGHVEQNLYVCGWAKRGSVGVIGTNKSDSTDVVSLIIENLKIPKNSIGIEGLLKSSHAVINQVGWEKINASEVIAGELVGKPRIKIADWKNLISLGTFK